MLSFIMGNKERLQKLSFNLTVRVTDELNERLDAASNKIGAKQDVVRLALDIGLQHLENVKYNIAHAVLQTSQDNNINISNSDSPVIAIGSKNTKTKVKTKK